MAISETGSIQLAALPEGPAGSPFGYLVGTHQTTGDGTGGAQTHQYQLPRSVALALSFISGVNTAVSQGSIWARFFTGVTVNSIDEVIAFHLTGFHSLPPNPTVTHGGHGTLPGVFIPDESGTAPFIDVQSENGAGIVFTSAVRLLAFDPEVVRKTPLNILASFIHPA